MFSRNFQKLILIRLVIYCSVVVVLVIIIFWLSFDINRRVDLIIKNKKDLAFRSAAFVILVDLEKEAEQAKTDTLFLESILPYPDKLINFPNEISNLGKLNSVQTGFVFGADTQGTEAVPGSISFNLKADGSFENWLKFLLSLESSRYLINYDVIKLAGRSGEYVSLINGKVFSQ